MKDLDELFAALDKSKFRSRFKLTQADCDYIARKSSATIRTHAREFIRQRLAPAQPENDGKQTPMKGHPVFVAQHATGTCCRNCLSKWHGIEIGRLLTEDEIDYVVRVIDRWISRSVLDCESSVDPQMRLFPDEPV